MRAPGSAKRQLILLTLSAGLVWCLLSSGISASQLPRKRKPADNGYRPDLPVLVPGTSVHHVPQLWPDRLIELYDTVSITFIGDIMQHGGQIRSALVPGKDPALSASYDYSSTFRHISPVLKSSDLAIANLECPLAGAPYSGYPVFSAPEAIAQEALDSGIDLLLLANNHVMDQGGKGLRSTLDKLDGMQARHTGAYRNRHERDSLYPVTRSVRGLRIAFLNFTYGTNGLAVPDPYAVNFMDSTAVKRDIRTAKEMKADIIIACPHWGNEYQLEPSGSQQKWARMLIREGVDVIMGSHPHVPQSASISPGSMVFYSLGNYISNQSIPDFTQLELMVTIRIERQIYLNRWRLLEPHIEYLWCFKKGEFEEDYTVVPVRELIGKEEKVRNKVQYRRMSATYEDFLRKNLIKFEPAKH